MGWIHEEDGLDTGGISAPKISDEKKRQLLSREAIWREIKQRLFANQAFQFSNGAVVQERIYNPNDVYAYREYEYIEMSFDDRKKFFFSRKRGSDPSLPWKEISEQEYKPATGQEYMGYRPYLDQDYINSLIASWRCNHVPQSLLP